MSLGPMELALLLGLALLVFGPSRLPGLGRSLGDAIRGFKKGIDGSGEEEDKKNPEQIADGQNTSVKQSQKDNNQV